MRMVTEAGWGHGHLYCRFYRSQEGEHGADETGESGWSLVSVSISNHLQDNSAGQWRGESMKEVVVVQKKDGRKEEEVREGDGKMR